MNAKQMGLLFATGAIVIVSSVARSAFAGEVTVFADRDFKGNAMTVRGPSPNLERIGYNDTASSLVVRAGVHDKVSQAAGVVRGVRAVIMSLLHRESHA